MPITEEQRERYNARKRQNYAQDAEWRKRVNEANRAWQLKNADRVNEERKLRRKNDHVWREQQNAKRRGRDQRDDQLRTKYRITKADYDAMLVRQGGVCALCKKTSDKTLHVDHCHATGAVRGLLCGMCNVGLGCFKDDKTLLKRAISYLRGEDEPQYIF